MLMTLEQAYLCPEGHITDQARRCECGETNLASLAAILNRAAPDDRTVCEATAAVDLFIPEEEWWETTLLDC